MDSKIDRIKEIMQEYADNQDDSNLAGCATEILEIAQKPELEGPAYQTPVYYNNTPAGGH